MQNAQILATSIVKGTYKMDAVYLEEGFVRITDSYGIVKCDSNQEWQDRCSLAKDAGASVVYPASN